MRRFVLTVIALLGTLPVWPGPAGAGWVIDEVVTGGGESGRQQVFLQSNRMKTVLHREGQPASAVIVDLDAETITQVDYRDRWYVTGTVDDYTRAMGSAMAGASQQMQEALKQLPPEQRKMAEEMMRSRMPGGAGPVECREPRIEVRRGGQQAVIAGFAATRFDLLADGSPRSEMWVARDLTAWQELDRQKLERFAGAMARFSACGPRGGGVQAFDASWRAAGEGYPVRTVSVGSGTRVEVVSADRRPVPPAEFQAPPGFARRTLDALMSR